MKISLIGLSNSGRTTIFDALTGQNIDTTLYPTTSGESHLGIVKVPDSRLERLSQIFKPKKITYATIEYMDYIGLTKGDLKQNRKVFDLIKDSDAIAHVVRSFRNDAVSHPLGAVEPLRDLETVELELIFGDLEFVEKRLEKIEEGLRHGRKPDEAEKKMLLKCKEFLMNETPLRKVDFNDEEQMAMRPLQFLSTLPEVLVLNIGEKDIHSSHTDNLLSELQARYPSYPVLYIAGKLEMEISQLSPEDKKLFLSEMGLDTPASYKLIHACYDMLGLISFFTYAGEEVRAWTIKKGTSALKAAGKVHTDIERGFIRAETISFENFIDSGDIHTAREKGLLRLEGKTYEVKDGDIINFRFNV